MAGADCLREQQMLFPVRAGAQATCCPGCGCRAAAPQQKRLSPPAHRQLVAGAPVLTCMCHIQGRPRCSSVAADRHDSHGSPVYRTLPILASARDQGLCSGCSPRATAPPLERATSAPEDAFAGAPSSHPSSASSADEEECAGPTARLDFFGDGGGGSSSSPAADLRGAGAISPSARSPEWYEPRDGAFGNGGNPLGRSLTRRQHSFRQQHSSDGPTEAPSPMCMAMDDDAADCDEEVSAWLPMHLLQLTPGESVGHCSSSKVRLLLPARLRRRSCRFRRTCTGLWRR